MEVQVFSFMTSHGKYLTYRNTSSMYSLCIFCLLFILLITLKVGYSFQTSNLVKWPATSTYYYANHILYIQIVIDTACLSISRYYLCMELLHSHISFSVLTCYFFSPTVVHILNLTIQVLYVLHIHPDKSIIQAEHLLDGFHTKHRSRSVKFAGI